MRGAGERWKLKFRQGLRPLTYACSLRCWPDGRQITYGWLSAQLFRFPGGGDISLKIATLLRRGDHPWRATVVVSPCAGRLAFEGRESYLLDHGSVMPRYERRYRSSPMTRGRGKFP